MHLYEQFMKARHEEMLPVAAKDRLAAQARQARATLPAISHPAKAWAITAETDPTPRRPRTGHGRHPPARSRLRGAPHPHRAGRRQPMTEPATGHTPPGAGRGSRAGPMPTVNEPGARTLAADAPQPR